MYLYYSSLQLRHGFPTWKIASSILTIQEDPNAVIGAQIYSAIPFAVELRALLDFTFSRTSLDIFQFWQLWQYHYDLYCAKNSNHWYTIKILGEATWMVDKLIFGVLFSAIIILLMVGPLYFFSDYSGFVGPNPVKAAYFGVSFVLRSAITEQGLAAARQAGRATAKVAGALDKFGPLPGKQNAIDDNLGPSLNLQQQLGHSDSVERSTYRQSKPYLIFENSNPFFRDWTEGMFKSSTLGNETETRFFRFN